MATRSLPLTPGPAPSLQTAGNLCELFQSTVARRGDAPALHSTDGATTITWAQYGAAVRELAAGLHGLGVRQGDTVALMMGNRPEFHLLDTATLHLGATAFSIYTTFAPDTVAHLLRNAGAKVVVCAGEHVDTILAARTGTAVEHVIALESGDPRTEDLQELAAAADPAFDFDATWRAVEPGDVATLIYTSGTTGPPKGVELTHANVLAELRATAAVLPVQEGDKLPSAFPMAHAAERWASHYQGMAHGLEVTCVDDLKQLPAILADLHPDIWGSVPRVWEKLYVALQNALAADPDLRAAIDAGHPEATRALRAKVGLDRVRWAVVGSAPTPAHVLAFFDHIGVPVCEVWGMSELTSCATVNPAGSAGKLGTVGKPLPGTEIRLADDGEVEVRGDIVMRGYRGESDKTAETLTADGWLKTGDIGELDDDGFLKIVDRKKELIINASGKNMSPANIEAALKGASPLIGHAVAIGDGRPYITALLVLDPDTAKGRPDDHADALAQAVKIANEQLARVEQVKQFAVIDDQWEPGSELLTPTLKLKRRAIAARYAGEIENLYGRTSEGS